MELTLWTYEGPPHVGAMRIATAMRGVHYVLHAPQGDTYADLLFTMIERRDQRPPVTYTTFQARDLGADTSELFQRAVRDTYERHRPDALLVGASCTAELLQDDPGGLCQKLELPIPIVPLELPSYQRKENWGASETFYHLVRAALNGQAKAERPARARWVRPRCNLLGATALGFRHRDDVTEITRLLDQLGVDVAVVAPWQATVADLRRLPEADFNVVMYPEIGKTTADWLQRTYDMPRTQTVPIGRGASAKFAAEVCELMGLDLPDLHTPKSRWYAQSVDSTYLTGKRVFVFGDATHAMAAARIARFEMGFDVVGLGTYSREFAREVRELATEMGLQALITDNHLEVEAAIEALQPELILGTQMERHIAKRHGMPCAVISAPVHVQDFPARYSPQMGEEGSNVMFDTWIHPLMMGLEEHLLGMFREDFEFHGQAAPSHLGQAASTQTEVAEPMAASGSRTEHVAQSPHSQASAAPAMAAASGVWSVEAERELGKIPFFVRNKARRNTERYAKDVGVQTITVETLYEAKAHFSR